MKYQIKNKDIKTDPKIERQNIEACMNLQV